jgi:hypothetical protein
MELSKWIKDGQRGKVRLSHLQVLSAVLDVAEQSCKWCGLPKGFDRRYAIDSPSANPEAD